MNLSLDYANALRLLVPETDEITLIMVGCGGTGSWLAPAIARIEKLLIERGKEVQITFVDLDRVEEKNIYRQNFCQAEIGHFKAETLAARYGLAWGIEIAAIAQKFAPEMASNAVIVGCVDNAAGRNAIAGSMGYRNNWWLDCGNTKNYGQVLLGGGNDEYAYDIPGCCGWLPLPSIQHPELLKKESDGAIYDGKPRLPLRGALGTSENEVSCAEMAMQDSQGMAINQRMAAEAADYLVRMLVTKDLRKFATYIDLESGSCQSEYITQENLKKFAGKGKKRRDDSGMGCPAYIMNGGGRPIPNPFPGMEGGIG